MSKGNPFLKKATGTGKAPAVVDKRKHGLGRSVNFGGGVGGLLGSSPTLPVIGAQAMELPIMDIERSPYQPRKDFKETELKELAESLKSNGLVQPPTVRKNSSGKYELIAGERRLRAAQLAGWKKIRVTLVEADDLTAAAMTTTENLQREDLNPIEEAVSYKTLQDAFNLTQQQVAERIGKGRATVANSTRLLELPDEVKALVAQSLISVGHAKVLQGLLSRTQNVVEVCELAKACVAVLDPRTGKLVGGMTVRELERRIVKLHAPVVEHRSGNPDLPDSYVRSVTEEIHRTLGCAVRLKSGMTHANGKHTKGVLEIDFIDNDDLDRILAMMGVKMD